MDKPTPIWKNKVEEINLRAEGEVDSEIDKLKASKWTAVILLGVAIVLIILLVRLF